MTVKMNDIKFIINDKEYYIYELSRNQIDFIYNLLSSSYAIILQNKDVKILFPCISHPYFLYELKINQLFMLLNYFKRIKSGNIIVNNSNVESEIALSKSEKTIIQSMAQNNLKITDVAKELEIDRNTVYKNIRKIKEKTNLSPNNFYHLNILMNTIEET